MGYRGIDVDVDKILRDFGKEPAGKPVPEAPAPEPPEPEPVSRAEQLADNTIGDPSLEHELREAAKTPAEEAAERQRLLAGARGKDPEEAAKEDADGVKDRDGKSPQRDREAQLRITRAVRGSMALVNVQKLIAIRTADGIQKSREREADRMARRTAAKGRVSTVQVPTVLLNCVLAEIGDLGFRISQNDAMAGFLHWYFGRPHSVGFQSEESENKVNAVVEALNANASPSRANQLNYNSSETLREKVDLLASRLDSIAGLLEMISKDSVGLKSRSDKNYIATCYLILNMLMFAPPPAPGQRPGDIDMLAGGNAWDLMDGITAAYEYFQTANGRELYKAKHGIRKWSPPTPSAPASGGYQDTGWSGGAAQRQGYRPEDEEEDDGWDPYSNDGYNDVPMEFEDDPFDNDMGGYGDDFAPSYLDDPDYDDGIEEGTPEYFAKKRAEAALLERIKAHEDDEED